MPTVTGMTRELVITYGTYTVGGSTGIQPTGIMRREDGYESGLFTAEFRILAANPAALITATATALAAYRKPRQALLVTIAGNTWLTWSQTANTGFDADPKIEKIGLPTDNGCSQTFRISVTVGLPADNLGLAGRRKSTIDISYDEAQRRTLTITGEYTALSSNSSTAQYASAAATYFAAVISGIGGAWDRIGQATPYFETDKVIGFTVVYKEIIYKQAGAGTLDNTSIIDQNFSLSIRKQTPGDSKPQPSPRAKRIRLVDVRYTCAVDKDVSTDLDGIMTTVKAFVLAEVNQVGGFSGKALVMDDAKTFPDTNRLELTQTWELTTGGWLEYTREFKLNKDPGTTLVPVWDNVGPESYPRIKYQGPSSLRLTVAEKGIWKGKFRLCSCGTHWVVQQGAIPTPPPDHEWASVGLVDRPIEKFRGLPPNDYLVTEWERTEIFEAWKPVVVSSA